MSKLKKLRDQLVNIYATKPFDHIREQEIVEQLRDLVGEREDGSEGFVVNKSKRKKKDV